MVLAPIVFFLCAGCGEEGDDLDLLVDDHFAPEPSPGLYADAGDGVVHLRWGFNDEPDLSGYNLYRSTYSNEGYTRLNVALIKGNIYQDHSVVNGIAYYYTVRPVDASGNEGGASNEVRILTTDEDFQAAFQLYADRKHEESLAAFQEYLDGHSENNLTDDALYFVACSHYWLGESELSKSEFLKLLEQYPEGNRNEMVKTWLATFIADGGDHAEAIAQFREALAEASDADVAAHALRQTGSYYSSLGLHNEAIASYQEILEKYPDTRTARGKLLSPLVYHNIGSVYYELGDYHKAITTYQKGIQLYPHSRWVASAHMNIGRCYEELGDYTTAIIEQQKVIDNYSDSEYVDNAQFRIGFCYGELNEHQRSIDEYQRVIEDYPDSESAPTAQTNIGAAYEAMMLYGGAIQAYRKTVENYPDSDEAPISQYAIGIIYENLGQYEQAIAAWQVIIDRYPGTEKAAEAVEWITLIEEGLIGSSD
jgi:TolA-binding protein